MAKKKTDRCSHVAFVNTCPHFQDTVSDSEIHSNDSLLMSVQLHSLGLASYSLP